MKLYSRVDGNIHEDENSNASRQGGVILFKGDPGTEAGMTVGGAGGHCKKVTHRRSRWFFICGPCPRILATRHVALHELAPA